MATTAGAAGGWSLAESDALVLLLDNHVIFVADYEWISVLLIMI